MPLYDFYPTDYFKEKIEKIRKKDHVGHQRILSVIQRILENPADADGKMVGVQHHGRLKKYVGRKDYRLIYYWCEQCRKANKRLGKDCDHCEQIHDNSVVFFDVYHKNESAKLFNRK